VGLSAWDALRIGAWHLHPKFGGPPESPSPGTWVVRFNDWHPTRLNELLGNSRAAGRKKKKDREVLVAGFHEVPKASVKRRVYLRITLGPGQHGGDVDAYWKTVLDGLKHAGAIVDDRQKWCEIVPMPAYERGPVRKTEITVEDIV
jgi:hypothetical protein